MKTELAGPGPSTYHEPGDIHPDAAFSFDLMLNDICGRLETISRRGFLKRIHKLEAALDRLDRELSLLAAGEA